MQPLVGRRVAGLEDERRVVGDHPDADAEEVEDRAHPLRVAPGEVVVDGDDVDAAAGQRVEDRGQRRDEGLALAGPHLGDLALVEDGRRRSAGRRSGASPSVRFIASRVIAKTSGRTSSRAAWMRSFSRLRRALRARGGARGRGGGARPRTARPGRRPRGSRRGCSAKRARISSSESASILGLEARSPRRPAAGVVGSRGRSSRRTGTGTACARQV